MTRQPDLRAQRGGGAATSFVRRLEYREFREGHIHSRPPPPQEPGDAGLEDDPACPSLRPGTGTADRSIAPSLPTGPEWVATPTGEKILSGLRYAQLAGDIAVIYGGAGVGKSKAIEHYARTSPNVFSVELTPAHSAIVDALEEIAIAVGLRGYNRRPAFLHRAICTWLRGTNGLLVIDEAQQLGMMALDQVRGIHDCAKVGLALVGNERVYTQLAGNNRAAYLDRLYSRIGKRIHLRRSTDADADALAAAWRVEGAASRIRLREIGSKPGALRALGKVLRLASIYAEGEGRKVALADIEAAWRDLGALG